MMTADRRLTNRPLYLQVRDVLVERVAKGDWKPGHFLPNEIDLARELRVSLGTLRKALDLLEEDRVVRRTRGRGTVVNDPSSRELAVRFSNIRDASGERISAEASAHSASMRECSELERTRLALEIGARVISIKRVRRRDRRIIMAEDVALPEAVFPGLVGLENIPHRISVFAQRYGILLGRAEERVFISPTGKDIADLLGLAEGTPVLTLDRVVYALDGLPIEWRVGYCCFDDEYYLAEMR